MQKILHKGLIEGEGVKGLLGAGTRETDRQAEKQNKRKRAWSVTEGTS